MRKQILMVASLAFVLVTFGRVESKPRHPANKAKTAAVATTPESPKPEAQVSDEHVAPSEPTDNAPAVKETAAAPQASPDPKWEFTVTPYLFLARLDGTIGVQRETAEVSASFRDIFHNLDFALMGTFEAHKGNWSVIGDGMYMKLSTTKVTPNPLFSDIDVEVKQLILDGTVGYRVLRTEHGYIDVLGGARFWHVKPHLTFQPRIRPLVDVEESKNWADPIVGARGATSLSPKVFVMGRFDAGGFGVSSDFTGQVYGAVGFQLKPRVALVGGYRYLRVDYVTDTLIYRTALSGPVIGAQIKF